MYPIGETKAINFNCPPGEKNSGYSLRPPEGYEWLLYFLWASQNHAGGNTVQWFIRSWSEDMNANVTPAIAAAVNESIWFAPLDDNSVYVPQHGLPFRFTFDCFPCFNCSAMAAGEGIHIEGMILERPANLELTLRDWYAKLLGQPMPAGMEGLKNRIEYYRGGI